jgi:hypothetical protein
LAAFSDFLRTFDPIYSIFFNKEKTMSDILLWAFNINAWITIVTVIVLMGVLLLTKVRTDAVFLIAIGVMFCHRCA